MIGRGSSAAADRMLFPAWETFYVIVGSSAGALTGLMFVVIALVVDFDVGTAPQLDAFGTPTVVHFGAALLLSVIVTAPWPTLVGLRLLLLAFGAAGTVYMVLVLRRTRRQNDYQPVLEDWLFHAALPLVAYAGILVAALALPLAVAPLLFVFGGGAVLLLF